MREVHAVLEFLSRVRDFFYSPMQLLFTVSYKRSSQELSDMDILNSSDRICVRFIKSMKLGQL